jgi:hypothetical protein
MSMRAHLLMVVLLSLMTVQLFGCRWGTDWYGPEAGGADTSLAGGAGGSGGASSCEAECVRVPRWHGPSLFAIGPFMDLPACPDPLAPDPGIELYGGLDAPPLECPTCQCGDSETECHVPADWHASAAKCDEAGSAAQIDFSAPPGWQGECTAEGAIPAGALCNGLPCVQSVTVKAPEVAAAPCSPVAIGGSTPPVTWETRARECLPAAPDTCPVEPPACLPPGGLQRCIHRDGDLACEEPYPRKHLFFRAHDDRRSCSPCACGPPADNACIVFVTAYTNAACGAVAGAINVASNEGPGCFDVPAGFPLAAKTAEVIAAPPGSCTPSPSEPAGNAIPAQPVTVCCSEEKVPD